MDSPGCEPRILRNIIDGPRRKPRILRLFNDRFQIQQSGSAPVPDLCRCPWNGIGSASICVICGFFCLVESFKRRVVMVSGARRRR